MIRQCRQSLMPVIYEQPSCQTITDNRVSTIYSTLTPSQQRVPSALKGVSDQDSLGPTALTLGGSKSISPVVPPFIPYFAATAPLPKWAPPPATYGPSAYNSPRHSKQPQFIDEYRTAMEVSKMGQPKHPASWAIKQNPFYQERFPEVVRSAQQRPVLASHVEQMREAINHEGCLFCFCTGDNTMLPNLHSAW